MTGTGNPHWGSSHCSPQSCVFDPGGATPNQIPYWSVHWNFLTKIVNKLNEANESLENSEKKGKHKHQPKKDWKLFPVERFWAFFIWMWTQVMLVAVYFFCAHFGLLSGAKSVCGESKIDNSIEWFEHLKSWLKQVTIHSNEHSLLQRLSAAHQKLYLETIKSLHADPKNKFDMLSDQIQTLLNLTSIRLQMVCDLILMLFGRNLCECHAQHTLPEMKDQSPDLHGHPNQIGSRRQFICSNALEFHIRQRSDCHELEGSRLHGKWNDFWPSFV